MVATAVPKKIYNPSVIEPKKKYISWRDFQRRYLSREDSYKYEWLNGTIEKTPRTMNPNQFYIWRNLSRFLRSLEAQKGNNIGEFPMEGDIFFLENHRRPDIVFLNDKEIEDARYDIPTHPEFIIEILSPSDNINRVNKKVENYFDAGVKVLWHIFPEQKIIHVFSDSRTMTICRGTDMCSAESVIESFTISVNDILK
jgi:Uma2 family endonuclease